jgi:hypothetical protein
MILCLSFIPISGNAYFKFMNFRWKHLQGKIQKQGLKTLDYYMMAICFSEHSSN